LFFLAKKQKGKIHFRSHTSTWESCEEDGSGGVFVRETLPLIRKRINLKLVREIDNTKSKMGCLL